MMSEMQAQELLQAKALGCLDPEDDAILNKLMEENENFPWQQLGHYQNLVALLPTLLEIEVPRPEVKDDVARKLYELGEKAKVEKEKEAAQNVIADEKLAVIEDVPAEKDEITEVEENLTEKINGGSEILFKEHGALLQSTQEDRKKDTQKPLVKHQQQESETKTTPIQPNKEVEQKGVKSYVSKFPTEPAYVGESKNKKGLIVTIILFVVALLAIFFVYFKLSAEIQEIRNELDGAGQSGVEILLENTAMNKTFST